MDQFYGDDDQPLDPELMEQLANYLQDIADDGDQMMDDELGKGLLVSNKSRALG